MNGYNKLSSVEKLAFLHDWPVITDCRPKIPPPYVLKYAGDSYTVVQRRKTIHNAEARLREIKAEPEDWGKWSD